MRSWWPERRGARPVTQAAPAAAQGAARADTPARRQPPEAADALLRRLEWTVLRRLDGLLQGDWRTLMRGVGLDLSDLREYQPHDDVRHIDWNVTARLQVPHVRVFTEDREMAAWFLLDLSGSVDFGSGSQRKIDVAAAFTAVMARLLTRRIRSHRPTPAAPGQGVTDLTAFLRHARAVVRRRSTVFVLSDFISTPGWDKGLAELARRHDVVAVRLLDPMELTLPDLGLLPIRDAETGQELLVDTSDKGFRRRFARIAAQREAELRAGLANAGVDTLELSTDDDLAQAVLRFAQLRRARARLATGGLPAHLRPAA